MFVGLARPELVHCHCTERHNPPKNRGTEAGGWAYRGNRETTAGNHGRTVTGNKPAGGHVRLGADTQEIGCCCSMTPGTHQCPCWVDQSKVATGSRQGVQGCQGTTYSRAHVG